MTGALPVGHLREQFAEVHEHGEAGLRIKVSLRGGRKQNVMLEIEGASPLIIRVSSRVMPREQALKTLVRALREPKGAAADTGESQQNLQEASMGRRLLSLLSHNARLRGVQLHLGPEELWASSDLVCLSGNVTPALLVQRIRRLASVADGMELRGMGRDEDKR